MRPARPASGARTKKATGTKRAQSGFASAGRTEVANSLPVGSCVTACARGRRRVQLRIRAGRAVGWRGCGAHEHPDGGDHGGADAPVDALLDGSEPLVERHEPAAAAAEHPADERADDRDRVERGAIGGERGGRHLRASQQHVAPHHLVRDRQVVRARGGGEQRVDRLARERVVRDAPRDRHQRDERLVDDEDDGVAAHDRAQRRAAVRREHAQRQPVREVRVGLGLEDRTAVCEAEAEEAEVVHDVAVRPRVQERVAHRLND